LEASTGYSVPNVQTLDSEVLHSMDPSVTKQVLTVAENLSFWTVMNTTLGVSAIYEP